MRYRDGRRSRVPLLAVGLPADVHVLRDRADALRRQPQRLARSSTRRCTSAARAPSTTLVFMGMGEPLMNLDAVLAPASGSRTSGITHRRTGVSTVGWIPGIERLDRVCACRSASRSRCTPPRTRCARS